MLKVTAVQCPEPVGDWRRRAACRDEDPDLFFPVGTAGPALGQLAEAKAVCQRCAVASSCLAWALESGEDAGVWGGMSEGERRALKDRNARRRGASGGGTGRAVA
jgi:WhiB family redox-sensing transcriptional regulator